MKRYKKRLYYPTEKCGTHIESGKKGYEYACKTSECEYRIWVYEDGSILED